MNEVNKILNQLEVTLNEYFGKQAPKLPDNIKEIIVKIAPYLTIISLILSVPVLLGFGGASVIFGSSGMSLAILLLIPAAILEAMAIPGLFARKAIAWKYMFWAQLISVVSSLIGLNIVGAVISALIGFYILFQVKSYYK